MSMRMILIGWLVSAAAAAQIDLQLTPIVDQRSVVDIRNAGDGSNRLFLVTITGAVLIYRNGELAQTPFIDIRSKVILGPEQGLLSMAFAPDYASSGIFFLYYTDNSGRSTLERYRVSDDPDVADAASGEVLLTVVQPQPNHNGGRIVFGPDGFLYLGIGDGGGAGDPLLAGQDGSTLLGKLLRLDVSGERATAAAGNPFLGNAGVRDEIWATGLRNPWRTSFDRMTGDLYIADVGQDVNEEINFQAANAGGGQNYGWNIFEGDGCFAGPCDNTSGLTFPIHQYTHADGCSITGGEVYRGPDYPALDGMYFYGDFCSGTIWSLRQENGQWVNRQLAQNVTNLTTFGEDERGNIYVSSAGQVLLISDGDPVMTSGVPMDGSFSGTYTVEGLNDQGFFVTVSEANGERFLFVAWFTFEQGQPLWLVGIAFFGPDETEVTLPMERLSGLEFLSIDPNTFAVRQAFGQMRFRATDCDRIEASYEFPTTGAGQFILDRLTSIEGRPCSLDVRKR